MALLSVGLILGSVLLIAGVVKRSQGVGRWLMVVGFVIIAIAVAVAGYGDVKTGFIDALRD